MLAVALARQGEHCEAWARWETDLARGLLDDRSARAASQSQSLLFLFAPLGPAKLRFRSPVGFNQEGYHFGSPAGTSRAVAG
jgi:hypothetical protein